MYWIKAIDYICKHHFYSGVKRRNAQLKKILWTQRHLYVLSILLKKYSVLLWTLFPPTYAHLYAIFLSLEYRTWSLLVKKSKPSKHPIQKHHLPSRAEQQSFHFYPTICARFVVLEPTTYGDGRTQSFDTSPRMGRHLANKSYKKNYKQKPLLR